MHVHVHTCVLLMVKFSSHFYEFLSQKLNLNFSQASGSFVTASPEPLSASTSELLVTPTSTGLDRSISPLEAGGGGGGGGGGAGSLSRGSSQDISEVGLVRGKIFGY